MPSLSNTRPYRRVRKGLIQHVVIIVQENRTVDNLFQGLPGADTASSGQNSEHQTVRLKSTPMTAPFDMDHKHSSFETEYAGGRLDGFNESASVCSAPKVSQCPPPGLRAYSYVTRDDVKPYFTMAERYTFADRMFQTNEGPSFPAHQYIISGTSTIRNGSALRASGNPSGLAFHEGGCDSAPRTLVDVIDPAGHRGKPVFPCFDRASLMDLIDAQSLTWHYYQAWLGPGYWNAPDAVSPTYKSPEFSTDVVAPPSQVLTDVGEGRLANVSWVTPTAQASDHAGVTNGSGPSWVASVVNAIGESPYWDDTVIFVTWDDWGGWYDHVRPTIYNSYELGFRVPLIVISPYAKTGYVSHAQHEFGSILKFTEKTFGLGSLGTTDVRADDLSDCFDFRRAPRRFRPIRAPLGARYFLEHATSSGVPDDDR